MGIEFLNGGQPGVWFVESRRRHDCPFLAIVLVTASATAHGVATEPAKTAGLGPRCKAVAPDDRGGTAALSGRRAVLEQRRLFAAQSALLSSSRESRARVAVVTLVPP